MWLSSICELWNTVPFSFFWRYWFWKLLILICLWSASYYIPIREVEFRILLYVGMTAGGAFIFVQLWLLIDLAASWNERWLGLWIFFFYCLFFFVYVVCNNGKARYWFVLCLFVVSLLTQSIFHVRLTEIKKKKKTETKQKYISWALLSWNFIGLC